MDTKTIQLLIEICEQKKNEPHMLNTDIGFFSGYIAALRFVLTEMESETKSIKR